MLHRALLAAALLLSPPMMHSSRAQVPRCQLSWEFQAIAPLPSPFIWRPHLADLNGDGVTDILFTGSVDQIYILINDGTEQFSPVFFDAPPVLTLGDVDQDGDVDLLHRDGSISLNTGFGAFYFGSSLPGVVQFTQGAMVDFDSDGDLDLYAIHAAPASTLRIYENRSGTLTLIDEASTGPLNVVRYGDVTGDDVPDVLQLTTGASSTYTITPIGSDGSISASQTLAAGSSSNLEVGDADGIPPLDVLLFSAIGPDRLLLSAGTEIELLLPFGVSHGRFADIDADGVMDLLAYGTDTLFATIGLGGGSFRSPVEVGGYPASGGPEFVTADLNQDGLPDLASAGQIFWNRTFDFEDCDGNGVPDSCDILVSDCNDNGVPDACDIASGLEADVDGDGLPDSCEQFLRGDTNGDGSVDVTDAVRVLFATFGGGVPLSCEPAGDVNDDDALDVSDAVTLLNHLFVTVVAVPAPYPNCGVDPTVGSLTCDSPQDCP